MIIPAGFAQINLIYTGASVPTGAQVTFGVDISGSPLSALEIGQSIAADYDTSGFQELMTAGTDLTGILVKEGPNATGASVLVSVSHPGINSDPASPAVAHLVHKHTNEGGRKARGRAFFPGVRESQVGAGGALVPSTVTLWNTALFDFHAKLATDSLPMVLLHTDSTAPYELVGWTCDGTVATQRRRQRR